MRPIGTPKQLQQRRRQALRLLKRGWRVTEVAQVVGVTPRSLCRWRKQAKSTKRTSRSSYRSLGRPCRLTRGQLHRLKRALARGPLAYGYPADYWTLARVRRLIRDRFDTTYQASSVWYLLRRMKWSCQKPQRLAFQRDDAAIAYWKRYRWPWIKKVADPGRNLGFSRRKWQIACLSTQAHLGPAWSHADPADEFATSPAGQLDRCVTDHAKSTAAQVEHETAQVQCDR